MSRWLPVLLAGCVTQLATALVATPSAGQLALHEGNQRTLEHRRSTAVTAEVAGLGEVALDLRQTPSGQSVVTGFSENTVYGSLMVLLVQPKRFVNDSAVRTATETAIRNVIGAKRSVSRVDVSLATLDDFPAAVRVDFQVAFGTRTDRQAFIAEARTSGTSLLVAGICQRVPSPYNAMCRLPGELEQAPLQRDFHVMSLLDSTSEDRQAHPFGSILLKPWMPLQDFFNNPEGQEALAMAIADVAWVSRLKVIILMTAESADTVRVYFWLLMRKKMGNAAIRRVMAASEYIADRTLQQYRSWSTSTKDYVEQLLWGRIVLEVPNAQLFAGNDTVGEAVESAVAQLAAKSGPEGSRLSVTHSSVLLDAVDGIAKSVLVSFQVGFGTARDRQVFMLDFCLDGGRQLANSIDHRLPGVCKRRCGLPGRSVGKVRSPLRHPELGDPFGTFELLVWRSQHVVRNPAVQDAMAMAISEMASVPQEEVGLLLTAESIIRARINYWVISTNTSFRQLAAKRIQTAAKHKFGLCTLAALDKKQREEDGDEDGTGMSGSIALQVPDAGRFAANTTLQMALKSAIEQVAALPGEQVQIMEVYPALTEGSSRVVRVTFQVNLARQERRKAFTQAIALDGGEKLIKSINARVPQSLQCQLPGVQQTKVSEVARPSDLGRPYGTMLLYVFVPQRFVQSQGVQDAFVQTIAEVVAVPQSQVGLMMTVESQAMVSIDFWVASTNTTFRQAAIRRFNAQWSAGNVNLAMSRAGRTFPSPAFLLRGGTVSDVGATDRYKC